MTVTIPNGRFRTEKKAPDGGFGYVIVFGLTLHYVSK